jgi:thiaminase/transcriptional activator TenA
MWGYSEVGRRLAVGAPPAERRYAAWIEMYASDDFAAQAGWCRELTDRVGAGLPPAALARAERAFVTSSRWELAFWDMAWRGERWPA